MILYKTEIASSFQAVHETVGEIMDQLKLVDALNQSFLLFRINFMLREVLNNAVEHGNKFEEHKRICVEVSYEDNVLLTKVKDEGDGPDLETKHEHKMDYILRERTRGITLVQQYQFKLAVKNSELYVTLDLDAFEEEVGS